MSKFKIGDIVRVVVECPYYGREGEVTEVYADSVFANVCPEEYILPSFYDSQLVLVKRNNSVHDKRESPLTEPLLTLANITPTKDIGSAATNKIKSDGGSSDYYKVELALPVPLYDSEGNLVENITFETQDILYALVGGEWTLSNIVKACRRAWLSLQGGGKEGNDITYEAKKIHWFAGDFIKRFGKGSDPRKDVI